MKKNKFINKNIDKEFIDIIVDLFKNKIIEDYKYIFKIIKDLEINKIDMIDTMLIKIRDHFKLISITIFLLYF